MGTKRNVSFPEDNCIVTGFSEPCNPWKNAPICTAEELVVAYKKGCELNGVKPWNKIIQQLLSVQNCWNRHKTLSLKGEKLDQKHCEALEDIFRRVQFENLELEACHLDDETAAALFDMIEYYDSTMKLNMSFNKNISIRGWQSCSRMIRKTPSLSYLDARGCELNDHIIPVLGRSLKMGSNLTVLHLEYTCLSGRPLVILVAALKVNEILQELFLGDNKLMASDGIQIGNLLKFNHKLQLLDLRNNHLQDVGLSHICAGLCEKVDSSGLSTLVLWNNQMSYQGMLSLSHALSVVECLETLNLGHNSITNEGIHYLKEGLLKNKSLIRLGLQGTKVLCEGAVALAEYIADSSRLLQIDLRENDIRTAGLMALSLALKVNESLVRLELDRNTKKEVAVKDYADQQRRLLQDINNYLERKLSSEMGAEMCANVAAESLFMKCNKEVDYSDQTASVTDTQDESLDINFSKTCQEFSLTDNEVSSGSELTNNHNGCLPVCHLDKLGEKCRPEFHTNLSLNGMTQELANVLDSLELETNCKPEVLPHTFKTIQTDTVTSPAEYEKELDDIPNLNDYWTFSLAWNKTKSLTFYSFFLSYN
ncbi:PPP1R37 [Acanthosepion pharaonis]|uniref:PPP1R37 n=1 Tax=Acanthosepion pharaonis TaxID=158019 RepID=A0A812BRC6_ACAPH|nr:PPP1R37 [Sepia pharaonis]